MRAILIILIVLSTSISSMAQSDSRKFSLEEAAKYAVQNNIEVKLAEIDVN